MKDGKQRLKPDSALPSARGTYAKQACSHCRKRKSKCDGIHPVCGPCEKAGRASECTWGKETAKKARTQQHFESLENYIRALETKVKDLQTELEYARSNRPGPSSPPSSHPTPETHITSGPLRESSDLEPSSDDDHSTNEGSEIDHLISPTRHLLLQDTDLEFHGPTSVWRLGAQRASPSTSEAKASASPEPAPIPAPPPPPASSTSTLFDWSRHLPLEVPLSRAEHDRLLEILFKFHMCWCMRMIPELFLRDMHRALSVPGGGGTAQAKSAHYSPMLHNAALALAAAYSDDAAIRAMRCRRAFAEKAKSYIEVDCQSPTIAVVTGLGVLALFHSVCGEQSLGYLYFGMAGRMSQSLGLSTDCSAWVKSGLIEQADMLDRNWAYWTTLSQDTLWSLYVGRECCITPPRKEDPRMLPVPYVGSEIDTGPWFWAPSKMPPQPSYVVSTFAVNCELLLIGRRIFDFVNSLGPGSRREGALQTVSELDIQLNNWKDSLSPELDLTAASRPNALPHRLMGHLAYWWLLLLLHRPFYRRAKSGGSSLDIDHVKLCNRAGDNIMLLLGIWNDKYSLRYLPITLIQVVYCAGTSFVLSAVQATSGPRLGRVALNSALTQAEQCIRYLLIAGNSFECANSVAGILSNLLHDQLKPRLLMRTLEPKDLLPSLPTQAAEDQKVPKSEYAYPASLGPNSATSIAGAGTELTADALSLATTISNLDTLRDQCRYTAPATFTPYSSEWPAPSTFPLLPVSAQSSSASSGVLLPQQQQPAGAGAYLSTGQMQPEDVDMDFGMGIDMGIMGGQPLSNRPYMTFDIPDLGGVGVNGGGVGAGAGGGTTGTVFPDIDPPQTLLAAAFGAPMRGPAGAQTQQQHQPQQQQQQQQQMPFGAQQPLGQPMQLDFSAEELAVMEQIMKQFGQGMDYRMGQGAAGQPRYNM